MYNTKLNNHHTKPKNSTIYTPPAVSQFLFQLLKDKIPSDGVIFDPCYGKGSLLEPWKENSHWTYGSDIKSHSSVDLIQDFLNWNGGDFSLKIGYRIKIRLVLCNPPFNGYKNKLGSEVWLAKIIELFGQDIPIVLFAPMGFRLNGKQNGKRWTKFTNQEYPPISSIISLPRDIFPQVEFHSEILIFNIPNLQPHYFFAPTSKIEQRTPI